MSFSLACNDIDSSANCPFVAHGNSEEQVITDTNRHAKTVHGYTDEQLNNSDLVKKMKSLIKHQ